MGCIFDDFKFMIENLTLEGKQSELDSKYCFILKKEKPKDSPFFKFLLFLNIALICLVGFMIFYVQKDIV